MGLYIQIWGSLVGQCMDYSKEIVLLKYKCSLLSADTFVVCNYDRNFWFVKVGTLLAWFILPRGLEMKIMQST